MSTIQHQQPAQRSKTPRQYLAGRNMVLYVRKHATALQAAKFLTFLFVMVPTLSLTAD